MITQEIRLFCKDYTKIENYELAVKDVKTWNLHHRLETHFSDGTERPVNARLSMKELKALNMYYDRPPEELIFLTWSEHSSLHNKGKKISEETRRKMTEVTRRKMTEVMKKRWSDYKWSGETRRKMSEAKKGKPNVNKGRHWYTDGSKYVRSFECPEGFVPGNPRKRLY